jgi:hypothetical protein
MKKNIYTLCFVLSLCTNFLSAQRWVENTTTAGLLPVRYSVITIEPVSDSVVWLLAGNRSAILPIPPKLLRTLNSGVTWEVFDMTALSGRYATKMVAFDSLTVLIATFNPNANNSSSVFKTIDGGRTWTEKLKNIKSLDIFQFSDKRNGIVIGFDDNIVANTADGGNTWTVDSTTQRGFGGETLTYSGSSPFNKDTICFTTRVETIGSGIPRFFRSTDKGRTWQRFSPLNTPAWNDAFTAFKDGNNGLMATNVETSRGTPMKSLLKTSNGGETWEAIPNLPTLFTTLQVPALTYIPNTKNSYFIMGVSTTINSQYTTDGGLTWTAIPNITFPSSGSFSPGEAVFSSAKVGWYTLQLDNASPKIYKWDGSNVLSRSNDIAVTNAITVSPNPSTGMVNISWRDALNTPPQYLRVSDAQGKIVFEKKEFDWGINSQSIDLKELANGLYFIELQNQNSRSVEKLVIQH